MINIDIAIDSSGISIMHETVRMLALHIGVYSLKYGAWTKIIKLQNKFVKKDSRFNM